MTFQPRRLANGRICCSHPDALCAKCEEAFRTATTCAPPDSYAPGIAALRAARGQSPLRKAPAPTDYTPPNPYTAAIEELKRSEQR